MAEYINPPFEADASTIEQNIYTYLQTYFPDFAPKDTHLIAIFNEALSQEISDLMRLAADVPPEIFLYFGKLVNIEPQFSAPATGSVTFTAIDTDGYIIPTGTALRFLVSGDEYSAFLTQGDAIIPAGSTTVTGVQIAAIEEGTRSNGLNTAPQLLDVYDFVDTVTLDAPTSGGADADDIDEYLDKLANRLQLLADRPIVPVDFEVFAKAVIGVGRALAVDLYHPGIDEIQSVRITNATGGTFTLTFEGQTTAAINYNDNAATIQTRLEALSNIAPGDVIVTGGPVNTADVFVQFTGALGRSNRTQMTSTSSLTGGGAAVTHATTTAGVAPASNVEKCLTIYALDEAGATLTSGVKLSVKTALQAVREVNFLVFVENPTFNAVTIAADVKPHIGFDTAALQAAVKDALEFYLHPSRFNRPIVGETTNPAGPDRDWVNDTKLRYFEVASIINAVGGVNYINTLTINGVAGDLTLTGNAPLIASAPTLNITVTA